MLGFSPIYHHRAATTKSPERVIRHIVAGGDVNHLQLAAVPRQGLAGVVRQAGAAAEVELLYVGTVSGKCGQS